MPDEKGLPTFDELMERIEAKREQQEFIDARNKIPIVRAAKTTFKILDTALLLIASIMLPWLFFIWLANN